MLHTIDREPEKHYSVSYLFYSRTDSLFPDICMDPDYPGSLRAIVNL